MKKISVLSFIAMLSVGTFSCKRTLDVNQNPNAPSDVPVNVLLPAAQTSISTQLGNYFQIVGGIWAQYWTQNPNSSQYRSLEQYQPGPATANTAWSELYAGALTDLDIIIRKADNVPTTQSYAGIARILKGFTFQLLTDQFGDIPFSQALMGDKGITNPKYDAQKDVYRGIIALVKQGRDDVLDGAEIPNTDDLIYGSAQDPARWRKFANTLLLRLYLRMAYVDPATAQQGIVELSSQQDGFISEGETGQINYLASAGNTNPLYSEMVGLGRTQNLIASETSINAFPNEDPRIDVFYNTPPYNGLPQGYYSIPLPGTYTTPGVITGALANPEVYGYSESQAQTAPVKFITSYESYFLQAEAAARGWLGGNAEDLYNEGVHANFAEFGLPSDAADTLLAYYPYPTGASVDSQIAMIITQKWFSMNGNQNIEAWTEWRRTGYPDFFTISVASRIGQQFPVRLPYPETEITNNSNFPGQKQVTDKVWWDVN